MSNKIRITCDSTSDLPEKYYEKYQTPVVPLIVNLENEIRLDGVNICLEELFEYVDTTGKLPKTSAVSVYEFQEFFTPLVKDGCELIHISLGSDMSSTYQNACIAAQEIPGVHVIDSRNLSSASGLLLLMAQEMVQAGMNAQDIVAELNDATQRLDASFVIQTLDYLYKGGRCSGLAAFGANLMKLRPEIVVTDGKLNVGKKYRGSMEKSILSYVRGRLEGRDDVDPGRICVTHSKVSQDIVDKVVALVKELQPFEEVIETYAGSSISCHCGPNCLGVLFLKKKS